MGNRPKATKLKLLTGNPGRRPINKKEPQAKQGIPRMPMWLKEFPVAVKEWRRESRELDYMGIMSTAESGALAMRCYLSSQIQQMAHDIEKEGRVVYAVRMDSLGNEILDAKTNPKCVQIKNLITEYRQYGGILGLDQISRVHLKTEKKTIDPGEEFLSEVKSGRKGR